MNQPNPDPPELQAAARRIRDGDVAAFEAVFRAYYGRLCSFVRQQVGSADAAEEIVEEVFYRVWAGRQGLDPDQSLRAYLYRAARNTVINQLKRRQIEQKWAEHAAAEGEAVAHDNTDDAVRTRELADAIHHAVDALPERCRLIFTMSRDHGLTYAEIADSLDISVKTVETQMGRALKALRVSLAMHL